MNKSSGAFSVIVVGRGGDGSDGNTYNAGGGGGGGGIGVWDNTYVGNTSYDININTTFSSSFLLPGTGVTSTWGVGRWVWWCKR